MADHTCPNWAETYQVDEFGIPRLAEDGGLKAWAEHQVKYHSTESEEAPTFEVDQTVRIKEFPYEDEMATVTEADLEENIYRVQIWATGGFRSYSADQLEAGKVCPGDCPGCDNCAEADPVDLQDEAEGRFEH